MINLLRGLVYFVVLVLIQALILNNIHFLRIATLFLYLDFIISFRKIVPECILICVVFFNYWQVFQYFQLATIFEIRLKNTTTSNSKLLSY